MDAGTFWDIYTGVVLVAIVLALVVAGLGPGREW